jgi:peptidyl-prolyl cis-trans isomerase A (cyclophilin A)
LFVWAACWSVAVATRAAAEGDLRARLTTSVGDLEVRLFADKAPRTVGNFVALARRGFYDGTKVHKIIPGFVIEAGAPRDGEASGGPGYCFDDEINPDLKHDKAGILSMANAGPDTNGSRFLLTLGPAPRLDGQHSVFGEVVKGLDVLSRIGAAKTSGVRPAEPIVISKVTIVGEFTGPMPELVREYTKEELDKLTSAKVRDLLSSVGRSLGYGKLQRAEIVAARSRCSDSQAEYEADFSGAKGTRLLIYGRASGGGFDVQQFQFGRRSAP